MNLSKIIENGRLQMSLGDKGCIKTTCFIMMAQREKSQKAAIVKCFIASSGQKRYFVPLAHQKWTLTL
jgi:hypothetical protein